MFSSPLLCLYVFCITHVLGAIFESPTPEILNSKYDIIIIGAGAGGAVMANRLTEDNSTKVLLIEAGGSDFMNTNILAPGLATSLSRSKFDWNFTTTPQVGLNNRSVQYPRGFVLGGSTAINLMIYSRGTIDDFNRVANVSGDEGWSWNEMLPFVFKVDNMTTPTDGHNTTGQFNPALHNTDGVVDISVPGVSLDIDARGLNASQELPDEFPFNLDYNSGNTTGFSWTQATIHDGRRTTSATSYLAEAFNRTNLDILVNTRVTKIAPVGEVNGVPDLRSVQFAQSANGTLYTLEAAEEVILSAGAVQSPHILMLSGIGNKDHISSFGIKTLVDLPAVGTNMQDHVFLGNSWLVNSNFTLDDLHRNATLSAEQLQIWEVNGTGLIGLPPTNQFAWLRVDPSVFQSLNATDPSAGTTSANFEMIISDNFASKRVALPAEGHFLTFVTNVVSPSSRGNISLASANPFDAPLINPNLLGTDVDVAIMRSAIKAARAFAAAPAWSDYIISEFGAFANATTDEELDAYIRDNADTVDHPVGTVPMGKGCEGALNADLTVKGTAGLRVIDASAFPFVPSGHTQGPTYILAERAAELVKASLGQQERSRHHRGGNKY
ncbi:alcohol oxidase [Dichomitus squalens]|uniref:Alcohol oxidase n=1 Tax=Dichomitus squalens TaxID=114155 RepID=A0A4V2JZ95_9APHY|nr:alcohol oxidase [Dichomitus squalens]